MVVEGKGYLTAPIEWSLGEDPEYPYQANHEGHKLLVRLNEFPEEELYALIANGKKIVSFDDWPNSWTRPSLSENYPDGFVASESTRKEAVALREKVKADVYLEVKTELDNASPTDLKVLSCWGAGMNLQQISEVTGIPIATVQIHLTTWQNRVLKKIGLLQTINKNPEHQVGAYEMIQNVVKKLTRAA